MNSGLRFTRHGIGPVAAVAFAAGCAPKQAPPAASPTPSPSPSPTPALSVGAAAENVGVSILDAEGKPVAQVTAGSAGFNPTTPGTIGTLQSAKATLYQKGKPAAAITAERVTADQQTRTVTATGSVVARSLSNPRSPTVRADKMTWQHDKNLITGNGNVLLTVEPGGKLPGNLFTADTALGNIHVKGNGKSATLPYSP